MMMTGRFLMRLMSVACVWAVLGASACSAAMAADEVPKGEVLGFKFSASKVFPGTVRDYSIYIPKQYDPTKPACVYVNQDGVQYKAKYLLKPAA